MHYFSKLPLKLRLLVVLSFLIASVIVGIAGKPSRVLLLISGSLASLRRLAHFKGQKLRLRFDSYAGTVWPNSHAFRLAPPISLPICCRPVFRDCSPLTYGWATHRGMDRAAPCQERRKPRFRTRVPAGRNSRWDDLDVVQHSGAEGVPQTCQCARMACQIEDLSLPGQRRTAVLQRC